MCSKRQATEETQGRDFPKKRSSSPNIETRIQTLGFIFKKKT